jgi:hypothetical protein
MHRKREYAFMKTLTIRNVPKRLADALDRERRRKDASLNSTVIDLLSRSLGTEGQSPRRNGLAVLAGTWDADDLRQFEAAVAPLDHIDKDMWA